jgi:hypothetical protein
MDKNKFWLGGRLFNTASPRLGTLTQCKARPQDGRPNTTQGTSASWAPKRNARHVRKLGAPTQCKARPQFGRPNTRPQHKRKARLHVRKLGAPTQCKAYPEDGRPNAKLIRNENVHTREHKAKRGAGGWIRTNFGLEVDFLIRPHQGWAPQLNARHVCKMGTQTQHKACPQVWRPNTTQGTSASCAPQRTSATQMQGTSVTQVTSTRPQIGRLDATQGTSVRWSP